MTGVGCVLINVPVDSDVQEDLQALVSSLHQVLNPVNIRREVCIESVFFLYARVYVYLCISVCVSGC
jgi:hypothetical protein